MKTIVLASLAMLISLGAAEAGTWKPYFNKSTVERALRPKFCIVFGGPSPIYCSVSQTAALFSTCTCGGQQGYVGEGKTKTTR
jgi:hypothetical protein